MFKPDTETKTETMLHGLGLASTAIREWAQGERWADILDAYIVLGRQYIADCVLMGVSVNDFDYRTLWCETFDVAGDC